jgi:hypothetical protein
MAIKYVLCTFGNFLAIKFIFGRFGISYLEKSGNAASLIVAKIMSDKNWHFS